MKINVHEQHVSVSLLLQRMRKHMFHPLWVYTCLYHVVPRCSNCATYLPFIYKTSQTAADILHTWKIQVYSSQPLALSLYLCLSLPPSTALHRPSPDPSRAPWPFDARADGERGRSVGLFGGFEEPGATVTRNSLAAPVGLPGWTLGGSQIITKSCFC